ncbi:UNVERIFIED_CONTAM: hypothetical protein K2H54_042249 [Gekko kuhli]
MSPPHQLLQPPGRDEGAPHSWTETCTSFYMGAHFMNDGPSERSAGEDVSGFLSCLWHRFRFKKGTRAHPERPMPEGFVP